MWVAVSVDDVLEEGYGRLAIQLLDWLHLDPLGELVHHDQKMGHASPSRLESSHHVQALDGEGPGDGDGSESSYGQVALFGEVLAPLASANEVFSVRLGCWPVVAVSEGLADNGAGRCVVTAFPLMDFLE